MYFGHGVWYVIIICLLNFYIIVIFLRKLGLPSQLRDTVLGAVSDNVAVPESEVNREFQMQQQIALLDSGENPWEGRLNPNEQLLELARNINKDRTQSRVKITVSSNR